MVAHRLDALEASGNATIAFLARGIEGLVVRITAKGETEEAARVLVEDEERSCGRSSATSCSRVDDETMEYACPRPAARVVAGRSGSRSR